MPSRGSYFARLAGESPPGIAALRPPHAVAWHALHQPPAEPRAAKPPALARPAARALGPRSARADAAAETVASHDAVAPASAHIASRTRASAATQAAPPLAEDAPAVPAAARDAVPARPSSVAVARERFRTAAHSTTADASIESVEDTFTETPVEHAVVESRAERALVDTRAERAFVDTRAEGAFVDTRAERAFADTRAERALADTTATRAFADTTVARPSAHDAADGVFAADTAAAAEDFAGEPRPLNRRAVRTDVVRASDVVRARDGEPRAAPTAPPQQPVVNIGTIDVRITQAAPAPAPLTVAPRAPAARAPASSGTLARGYGSTFGMRQQ